MTNIITAEFEKIEAFIAGLKANLPTTVVTDVKAVENTAKAIESKAWTYIKTNGLEDAYQIALTLVAAMVPGSSWTATLESVEAAVVADGKTIAKGAVAVVAAQAQADLISVGTLLPPVAPAATTAPVA